MKISVFPLIAATLFLTADPLPAQTAGPAIEGIPYPVEVRNSPVDCRVRGDAVTISAAGKTNLFNSPSGASRVTDAPMALFEPAGDFTLSARVSGDLRSVYDVAALVVYGDDGTWAKLCYENSVKEIPTIVSVVTRTWSDDCNSVTAGSFAYLAVVRKGNECSFFYSPDRVEWSMIRHFRLDFAGRLKAGFAAHESRGNGFTGRFAEIRYLDQALEDMRGL